MPGEAAFLRLSKGLPVGTVVLDWSPATGAAAGAMLYDLIRSTSAADFVGAATCVQTNGAQTQASDSTSPAAHGTFYYLVRAEDTCGAAVAGRSTSGMPIPARTCP